MIILVSGVVGFIGSNFVINWFSNMTEPEVNSDKLTHAGNPENLAEINVKIIAINWPIHGASALSGKDEQGIALNLAGVFA